METFLRIFKRKYTALESEIDGKDFSRRPESFQVIRRNQLGVLIGILHEWIAAGLIDQDFIKRLE